MVARTPVTGADPPTATAPGRYRHQLVRNTAAAGLSNGWTIVLTVLALPVLLHELGVEAFGTWAQLQVFSALTGWLSLADLGVGLATMRAVAGAAATGDRVAARGVVTTGLAVVAAIATVAGLALALAGPRLLPTLFRTPDGLVDTLQAAVVVFAIQAACELLGAQVGMALDGFQRIDLSRLLESTRRTAVIGAACAAAVLGGDLVAVVTASAVAAGAVLGVALLVLAAQAGGLRAPPQRAVARALLRDGRSLWLLSGSGVAHRTLDRLVVGAALGPAAVALVEIATQVQNGVMAIMSATSYTVTSSAAWVGARVDRARLAELLTRATRYTCLATLPVAAAVAVLSPVLVEAWLGADGEGAPGLIVLALVYLATQAPLASGSNLLVGLGQAPSVLRPALLALALNLALSLVLVQTNGVAGAFVATIASALVLFPLLARAVGREAGVGLGALVRQGLVPALVPTVAVAAVTAATRALGLGAGPTLFLGAGLAAGAWVATVLGLALGADERRELVALRPRRRPAP